MPKIYSKSLLFVFLTGLFLLFQACNIINPPEKVPTYIHVDSFIMDPNVAYLPNVGTSHQITSVWAYYNGIGIGAFDLPVTFPVITESDTSTGQLQLAPGIEVDGQNNETGIYPFYQNDISTFTAQPGKIINYTPHTSYYNTTKVTVISDFEGPVGFAPWAGGGGTTNLVPIVEDHDPADVYQGLGCGSITINSAADSSVDSTVIAFAIPAGAAYIELNYKNTMPFYLGLQANESSFISSTPYYITGVNPSATWQKFYFYLTDFAGEYKGTTYNFYIKASLSPGQTSGRVLLDNIQLVTF